MSLEGKVALVTGAARGIGRGIAVELADAGARVVVADLGDAARDWSYALSGKAELEEASRQVQARGAKALAVACDVTDSAQVENLLAQTLDAFGRLDLLVNNAGIVHFGPLAEFDEALWQRTFDVNVKGVFLASKAAIPSLVASKGAIVNIASVAGKRGYPGGSAYCGSKFAVVGITQSLARELGPSGVRVNAVCPGIVGTAMWTDHLTTLGRDASEAERKAAYEAAIQTNVPLGREQTTEDIARAVLYLAQAPNVTGVALNVAGGMEVW